MQLKKLVLQGFKSFADKTEIVFLDGVTTIVGPNGSGKSNISDALKWVLGEQSVKTLRGSKMEDVIFAGTQARKKVGFAEVSMYLDNTDGTLPVEYKEVVVTRRVYRTGESSYIINGNECRLKDIQELFMDTGVGKDGYSIISQGKIDEILSTKSEERRHIFEEASGIVKYRTRKEEATKKLSYTEETLSRVGDILNEIENTIGPLEKRAQTAKKYLELRDSLKTYDVIGFVNLVNDNANSLNELDENIKLFESDIQNEMNLSSDLERKKSNIKERLQEISLKVEETQNSYFDLQSELEKLNSKIDVNKSLISNNTQNILRMQDEIKEDNDKIELLKDEIKKRLEKKESMTRNKKKFEDELSEKQNELNKIMLTLDEEGAKIESVKKEIDESNDRKYDLKVEISSAEAKIESITEQVNLTEKSLDKNISQKDSLNATKDDIYMILSNNKKELSNLELKISEILKNKEQKQAILQENKNLHFNLNSELMSLKSKLNYLVNLEQENEGYTRSVKEALEYSKSNPNVYGTMASIISTDEKYEYAIEIALGGYIQNIVVQTENEAKEIISYLKEKSLGRATFLPLNNLSSPNFDLKSKVSKQVGYIAMANELVRFDKKYESAINLSLGTTVVVDNIDNATNMSKAFKNKLRIVTLSGELISPSGSITGGKNIQKNTGLLGRKEKIEVLRNDIVKKEESFNEHVKKLEEATLEVQKFDIELEENKKKKDEINIQIATYSQKYENIVSEIEKCEKQNKDSKQNLENFNSILENLRNDITGYNNEIEIITKNSEEKQVIVDEYNRFNKEKSSEMDFLNEDIVNLKISLSSFEESVASIDEMKEKIEQDIKNFEFSINRKNEQIELSNSNISTCNIEIENTQNIIDEKLKFKDDYQNSIGRLKEEKEDITKRQEEFEKDIIESSKKIDKLKEEKAKVEAKKVKFDIELENIKNKMWDEYELTISSAKKILETMENIDLTPKQVIKKSEEIKSQIKDLGEVNISSIEEYERTKERYDFILNQRKDLEETREKLNNLIANMTSIMKNQFSKQFKLITENFNETFKELFGGGKAELKLSDESNILESGIEIEVQPPGKKLQSMMLLSGGERALTATALLFAILKLKSPPFCILDEIEAALDDVNVHRFAGYIKKYSNNTQFIVITHRKGTMEVASSTYGVTMQEYGISKVISMKLK